MISPRLRIPVLLMCATFCVVSQSGGAGVFPAGLNDQFIHVGRTTNGLVRITGYHNAVGGFFEFSGGAFNHVPTTALPGYSYLYIQGVSRDGAYIAGDGDSDVDNSDQGVLWNAAYPNSPIALGFVSGSGTPSSVPHSVANTTNGPAVVGWTGIGSFVWSLADSIQRVSIPPPRYSPRMVGISNDGQIIAGLAGVTLGSVPVVRTSGVWRVLDQGSFPSSYQSAAFRISQDNSTVAGWVAGHPACWLGAEYELHFITMNGSNLPPSWGNWIGTDGGWVAGGSGGRGWIASVTDGKAQYVENWLHDNYGLVVTQAVTGVSDLLVDRGEMFMILENNSGGMLFTGVAPPQVELLPPVAGLLRFRFPTASGTSYQLLSTPSLPAVTWTPVPGASLTGDGTTRELSVLPDGDRRFYRLRIQ